MEEIFKEEKLKDINNISICKYEGPIYRLRQDFFNKNSCKRFWDENDEVEVIFPDGIKRKIKYPIESDSVTPDVIHTLYTENVALSRNTYLLKADNYKYLIQFPEKWNKGIIAYKEFFINPSLDITDVDNGSSTSYGSLFTSQEKAYEAFKIIKAREENNNNHYVWDSNIRKEEHVRTDLCPSCGLGGI